MNIFNRYFTNTNKLENNYRIVLHNILLYSVFMSLIKNSINMKNFILYKKILLVK
jgi:hypothetical protein